jgi:hypothetical protein
MRFSFLDSNPAVGGKRGRIVAMVENVNFGNIESG